MLNLGVTERERQLLNNGGDLPALAMHRLKLDGRTLIDLADLEDWLVKMADVAISDQKQEVYKGLREFLHSFAG